MFLGLVKQITRPDKNQRNKIQAIYMYPSIELHHANVQSKFLMREE